MSARRVERWLDLPPGAWQKRRLFALRIRGSSFSFLGLRVGDLVIVEPGAREQPGHVVVTRSHRGTSLRKIPHPYPLERRMPTVLELPLRERNISADERVVGTVIGLLRPTGTGALRPAALGTARSRPHPLSRRAAGAPGHDAATKAISPAQEVDVEQLFETQRQWHDWLSRARSVDAANPNQVERWERLDGSLATLCDCLAHTHSAALRAALAAEAAAVAAAVRDEMRG